jgi:hypothetical protein
MSHVFISYSRSDQDFVQSILIPKLQEAEISLWVDTLRIRVGDDWRQEIDNAIRRAFAMVVVMSPAADNSKYVTYEWSCAWGNNVPVFPVILEDVELHPRMESWQYLNYQLSRDAIWSPLIDKLNNAKENGKTLVAEEKTRMLIERMLTPFSSYQGESIWEQVGAARMLGAQKEKAAVPALIMALDEEDTTLQKAVIRALALIGDPEAIEHLAELLYTADEGLQKVIAQALNRLDSDKAHIILEKWSQHLANNSNNSVHVAGSDGIPF